MSEPDLVGTVAVEIEITAILQILDEAALTGLEHIETRSRKALVQKDPGIARQPLCGGSIYGRFDPLPSLR